MKVITFSWTEQAPDVIEHAARDIEPGEYVTYLRNLRAGAKVERFSYAVYDRGSLPWQLVVYFDVTTGTAGNDTESIKVPA